MRTIAVITIFVCLVGLQINAQDLGMYEQVVSIIFHSSNNWKIYFLIFIRAIKVNCMHKTMNWIKKFHQYFRQAVMEDQIMVDTEVSNEVNDCVRFICCKKLPTI